MKIKLSKREWDQLGKQAQFVNPQDLTTKEKAKRNNLIQKIAEWEAILKKEKDDRAKAIIESTIQSLRDILGEGGKNENKTI